MSLIIWSEKYSVKNILIDNQHKKLIGFINDLHSAMKEGKAKNVLNKLLDDLVTYTKEHFRTEERMMQTAGYTNLYEHKSEHDKLTQKVIDLQQKYNEGKANLTFEIMTFLQTWLVNHIEKTDKKYMGLL